MAKILKIANEKVEIKASNGKTVVLPLSCVNYVDPKVGDNVKVYLNGKNSVVSSWDGEKNSIPNRRVNKNAFCWGCCYLLGPIGVDRLVRGQTGLAILKFILNICIVGIFWTICDLITAIEKSYINNDDDSLEFDKSGRYL